MSTVPFSRRAPVDPVRFARAERELFAGQNLHTASSRVVHAVTWIPWLGQLTLPAPACRQGYAGTGTEGELRPTRWPVTCRRCRRLRGEDLPNEPESGAQTVLFPL